MNQILFNFKSRMLLIVGLLFNISSIIPISKITPSEFTTSPATSIAATTEDGIDIEPALDYISDPPADESFEFDSDLIIKALNPGYKIDGQNDVGEFIELQNLSDAPISLAGFSLRYTNGSGKNVTIISFSEGSVMVGEYLLLRYYKSPEADAADATYKTSLALNTGPLELVYEADEFSQVVDTVCWTGKAGCNKVFNSNSPTSLERNLITGEFQHTAEYIPHFDSASPGLILPQIPEISDPDAEDGTNETINATPKCFELEFSEIYTYYVNDKSEQFIELFNHSNQNIPLEGCTLRYKKKLYKLVGEVAAQSYYVYYPSEYVTLTKNPTTSNQIDLVDADGQTVDELIYEHGQKKSMAFAKFYNEEGTEYWQQTYQLTPGASNILQDQKICPAGKVINPLTGNCVNITSSNSTSSECPAGKYRNPLTGRCKNISSDSTTKECAEGYERNPETNRCRKIKTENTGDDYALVPKTESSKTTFVALWAVIGIVLIGIIYIILQFRREIARAARIARQRVNHFYKNLISRKSSGDGNKEA